MRRSFPERNNFSEGSSEPNKDAQVFRVRGSPASRVFEFELLVLFLNNSPKVHLDSHMINFNFLCTYIECMGEFYEVFSVGGDSFYVGVQRGDGGNTYFYHTNKQDVGLI